MHPRCLPNPTALETARVPSATLHGLTQCREIDGNRGIGRPLDAIALDGTKVPVGIDSICVHGDTPGAVAMALAVREALTGAGYTLRAFAP